MQHARNVRQCCNFLQFSSHDRPAGMAHKYATHAMRSQRRRPYTNAPQHQVQYAWNLYVKSFASDKHSARHGKQSQSTESNALVPRHQWPDWSLFASDSVARRQRLHDNEVRTSNRYPTRSRSSMYTRALFAMVPKVRNLCPSHQRIRENSQQP